jgi:hypothetical protein
VTLPCGAIELSVRSSAPGSVAWARRLAIDDATTEIVVSLDR